jgi:hypothetical protein
MPTVLHNLSKIKAVDMMSPSYVSPKHLMNPEVPAIQHPMTMDAVMAPDK